MADDGLHIALVSVHGLIRATELELGRDADTGGQTLYVVELARALVKHPDVARVDLVTRLIVDESVDAIYAQPRESICEGADIVRLACGGQGYLRKELLWDYLDEFGDNLIAHYRACQQRPHVLHSHYADAGLVGSRVAAVLQRPLLHTGHSLGRVKRRRLLASGLSGESIEHRYAIGRRIVAEEQTLASAARVIASTHQEIEEQYGLYDFYRPDAMQVLPPGTDVSRFVPPQGGEKQTAIASAVRRFLKHPDKPMILAVSRADARKNIATLVHAFGGNRALHERANLVVIMGNRDDLTELGDGARDVLTELLQLIDRYDLYGKVAYPKQHRPDDVPVLYRLATLSGGVFVNPALTEPFGLTLLEAAASGLPIVATEDGGPRDIVGNCRNGLLVDPLDTEGVGEAVYRVIDDWEGWQKLSRAGLQGVREHYSWQAHAGSYVELVQQVVANDPTPAPVLPEANASLPDRALFTDLNRALIGDDEALAELVALFRARPKRLMFGVTTGLRQDAALRLLKRHGVPEPDVLITSTGTHITYAPRLTEDTGWSRHIEKQWTPKVVRRVLAEVPGLTLRAASQQSAFKVSYRYDPETAPPVEVLSKALFKEEQAVNVHFSHGHFLNVVPIRASKGLALRYVTHRFGISLGRVLAIGGSGADADMMRGKTLAAVVGNREHGELSSIDAGRRVYFARRPFAGGIREAMDHYDFLGSCRARDVSPDDRRADAEGMQSA